MKTSVKIALSFVSVLLIFLIILHFLPVHADLNQENVKDINFNLMFSDEPYPEMIELIDETHDSGERVGFSAEFSKEFSRKFDVKHIDLSCGRLFILQEKNWLWGYRRTFILHRDINTKNIIMIDNSSLQNKHLKRVVTDLKSRKRSPEGN